jgi:hypothetical protein
MTTPKAAVVGTNLSRMCIANTTYGARPRLGLIVRSPTDRSGPKEEASTATLTLFAPIRMPPSTMLLDVLTIWLHKVHLHIETFAGLLDRVVDMRIVLWCDLGVPEDLNI